VELIFEDGSRRLFDRAVIATHADQALRLLEKPTMTESMLLGKFRYQENRAFLHSDPHLMPRSQRVWSAWNYLANTRNMMTDRVSVTYWMNLLQHLETERNYFVSLNPLQEPQNVHASMTYEHPVFDSDAMAAQSRLGSIQGRQRTWFCGSYFGYGFHEDALASAVDVASRLGVTAPWNRTRGIEAA
jgi:predicted NAD/FAD-binding protein